MGFRRCIEPFAGGTGDNSDTISHSPGISNDRALSHATYAVCLLRTRSVEGVPSLGGRVRVDSETSCPTVGDASFSAVMLVRRRSVEELSARPRKTAKKRVEHGSAKNRTTDGPFDSETVRFGARHKITEADGSRSRRAETTP